MPRNGYFFGFMGRAVIWLASVLIVSRMLNHLDSVWPFVPLSKAVRWFLAVSLGSALLMTADGAASASWSCHNRHKERQQIADLVLSSVVSLEMTTQDGQKAEGAGFIWDRKGHIVTNHHVIAAGSNPIVIFSSGQRAVATVIGDVPELDISVVTVAVVLPKPIHILRDVLRRGQPVFTIGNPFGQGLSISGGKITALRKSIVIPPGIPLSGLVETDIPFVPGNSGGPVFDCQGRVFGMAAAVLPRADGSGNAGYAIPANRLDLVVAAADDAQRAVRHRHSPEMGLIVINNRADRLVVANVIPEAPAALADVRAGDVLISANGHTIRMVSDLDQELRKPGRHHAIVLGIVRSGKKMTRRIPLDTAQPRSSGRTP